MPVAVPDVSQLPRDVCARLFAELAVRLLVPEPIAVTPLPRPQRLSMKEAATYVREPYNTFRQRWPKVPLLVAAHFEEDGHPKFLSTGLDEYLEQRGRRR